MKSTCSGNTRGLEPADHHRAPGVDGDLGRAAAAGEPHRRVGVVADHGGVDVSVAVDLRAAQEADLDPAVLQEVLEHIGHAADHQRAGDQRRVSDRDRQPLGNGTHRPALVDQHQVRRVGLAGEVAGQVGQPDADEHHLAVAELPGGDGGHHFGRGVAQNP